MNIHNEAEAMLTAAVGESSESVGHWRGLGSEQRQQILEAIAYGVRCEERARGREHLRPKVVRQIAMQRLRQQTAAARQVTGGEPVKFIPMWLIILLGQTLIPILIQWWLSRNPEAA